MLLQRQPNDTSHFLDDDGVCGVDGRAMDLDD